MSDGPTATFVLVQAAFAQPAMGFDAAAIERMKDDSAISAMLAEFSNRFPEVMLPLIHERDVYLAWSLSRSKAVRCLVHQLLASIRSPMRHEHARHIRFNARGCR